MAHVAGVGAVDDVEPVGGVFDVGLCRLVPVPTHVLIQAFGVELSGVVALSGHGAEGGCFAALGSLCSSYRDDAWMPWHVRVTLPP